MIEIGRYNTLTVARLVDFGLYLTDGEGHDVLLPARYVDHEVQPGDEMRVFVYTDSDDRLIATTEHPFARVGQVAFLEVKAVNRIGAFLDWGLPKDLLVPFSEQRMRMREGGVYPVYVYLDDASKRVAASARLERWIGNALPQYRQGQEVVAIPLQHHELGYKCVVDDKFWGMLYSNELFKPVEIGEELKAYVKRVRPDGKVDITLTGHVRERIDTLADEIEGKARAMGGVLPFGDHSDAADIKREFNVSKRDFKKAVGLLLKQRRISIVDDEIHVF